jgi:aminopeptidase-like protein
MKKYDDYKTDKSVRDLTQEELKKINWTKYKIIVPTEHDKEELEAAFEHIHYSDIDTDFVTVNQLAHEYLNNDRIEGSYNNIIVDYDLFKSVEGRKG